MIFLLTGCVNNNQNSSTEDQTDDSTDTVEQTMVILSLGRELVESLAGEYFLMSDDSGGGFRHEPCKFVRFDLNVYEIAEGSGFWELHWLEDIYPIHSAQEKDGVIYVRSETDMERLFLFTSTDDERLLRFAMMGTREPPLIVRVEQVEEFYIEPCTDIDEIMKKLPATWYLITEMDGKDVIYVECQAPPGGLSIGGGTVDFWSGSDPYPILRMHKSNNRITVVYKANFGEWIDSLVIYDLYAGVAKIGFGDDDDDRYVSEAAKERYVVVEEECL